MTKERSKKLKGGNRGGRQYGIKNVQNLNRPTTKRLRAAGTGGSVQPRKRIGKMGDDWNLRNEKGDGAGGKASKKNHPRGMMCYEQEREQTRNVKDQRGKGSGGLGGKRRGGEPVCLGPSRAWIRKTKGGGGGCGGTAKSKRGEKPQVKPYRTKK